MLKLTVFVWPFIFLYAILVIVGRGCKNLAYIRYLALKDAPILSCPLVLASISLIDSSLSSGYTLLVTNASLCPSF